MHTVSLRDAGDARREATFRASFPPPEPEDKTSSRAKHKVNAEAPSGFTVSRRPNIAAIAAVALVHVGLFAALIQMNVIPIKHPRPAPLVVELLPEPPAPPPAPPEQKVEPIKQVTPVIVAPAPIVQTLSPPPPVATVRTPPPPQAVVVAAKPVPAPAAPVSAGDLSSTMISFKAPHYPLESRRRKEQGTVLLNLLLAEDGSVQDISVQSSSGYSRLDQAALEAVRRWRWSPTIRNGERMKVRGLVEIPFILRN